jgi:hypothetical protein
MKAKKIIGAVVLGLAAVGAVASSPLQTPADAAALAQQVKYPAHFVYRFEAYDHGRFVGQMPWETDALNETHLLQLMANAQAGFAQRLNDQKIPWNAIHPIQIQVRPLR